MATSKNPTIEATEPVLTSSRARLSAHTTNNIFLGTSSWSFPGWSMVFAKEYREAQLAKAGLKAYANEVGENFRFLVKAPDLITGAQRRDEKGKPVVVFQFSPLPRAWLADKASWIERLEKFLRQLPVLPTPPTA